MVLLEAEFNLRIVAVFDAILLDAERSQIAPMAGHCSIFRAFKVERVDGLEVVQIPDRSEVAPIPAALEPALNVLGKRFPCASEQLEERLAMEHPGAPASFAPAGLATQLYAVRWIFGLLSGDVCERALR